MICRTSANVRRGSLDPAAIDQWPRLWRMLVIALGTLILCSCRSSKPDGACGASCPAHGGKGEAPAAAAPEYASLPPEAYTGAYCPPMGPPGMEQGVPLPYCPTGPWRPPGIDGGPWPGNEYVCDGGVAGPPVQVTPRREVLGLEVEDTIAHYDTLEGETRVQPSNRVCLYAPRFGAVRQVVNLRADEQMDRMAGMHKPLKVVRCDQPVPPLSVKQNVQPEGELATRPPVILRSKQGDGAMSNAEKAKGFQDDAKPYENIRILREGIYEEAEMPFLARGVAAAIAWEHIQAVQVILDNKTAVAAVGVQKAETIFSVKEEPACPRLRLIKVASTPFAEPGDQLDFTLRFDNVGNQQIRNVAILDSLSTRLEYVADSAQCSRDAKFSTEPNEGDSVVLRCELAAPLEPGQGGVIRFHCRVR